MKKTLLLIIILHNVTTFFSQIKYPSSKTVDSSDTLFGKIYKDRQGQVYLQAFSAGGHT
mgnify:CR=1 FL=1